MRASEGSGVNGEQFWGNNSRKSGERFEENGKLYFILKRKWNLYVFQHVKSFNTVSEPNWFELIMISI